MYGGYGDDKIWVINKEQRGMETNGANVAKAYGEHGNDVIFGSDLQDNLQGDFAFTGTGEDFNFLGGDDVIYGYGGDDRIGAGAGDDFVDGGDGDDVLYGRSGDDKVFGQDGNDFILGDFQPTAAQVGPPAVTFSTSAEFGNDKLYGGNGTDSIYGGYGDDLIFGDDGDDALFG